MIPNPPVSDLTDYYRDIQGRWFPDGTSGGYVLTGDTVMGGLVYKKLISCSNEQFLCGLREEDGRIYSRGGGWHPDSEVLYFDFNAQPGDIFNDDVGGLSYMQVKEVKTVMIGGKSRRCLEMWNYEEGIVDGLVDYWIEGIGCMNGPYFPFWWLTTSTESLLLSCYDGDECIFNIEDFLANFTTNMDSPKIVQHPNIISDVPIYDLLGRRVQSPIKKGFYIQQGRKLVVR